MPIFSNPLNDHWRTFPSFASSSPSGSSPPKASGSSSSGSGSASVSNPPFRRQGSREKLLGVGGKTFVYACFNSAYKLCPAVFEAFGAILSAATRSLPSALWLLSWPGVEQNLKSEAASLGIPAKSLVFTGLLPAESHLQTKAENTDLFLDTFAFNGHGTVSQMLWAAVPSLTLPKVEYVCERD